jgi:23S rRNA (cytidine1920-2'-O)/16S rRNA (cytidine1409-2'-O)-methyltransferase
MDVGHGILDYRLRTDPRVVVMENTNARYLEQLPEPVSLVTIDASFISLKLLLPVVLNWLKGKGAGEQGSKGDALLPSSFFLLPSLVALIKPQFEAGRAEVDKGEGVIKDPAVHRRVLAEVLAFAEGLGLAPHGLIRSPLTGPAGNVEFLAWLTPEAPPSGPLAELLAGALEF